MASTISDFNLQARKMMAEFGSGSNYASESSFNVSKTNPNKITVTVNNTGKTAKINYVMRIAIDAQTLYFTNNQCAFNFNDLRVYDSDNVTPLNFYVEAPATSYCSIFVLFSTLASSTRTIYFEFGNPALPSISNLAGTLGNIFIDSTLNFWLAASNCYRTVNAGLDNFGDRYCKALNNQADPNNFAPAQGIFSGSVGLYNTLSLLNSQPGLASTLSSSVNVYYQTILPVIQVNSGYTICAVEQRLAASAMAVVGDSGSPATNQQFNFRYTDAATFSLGQYNNDLNYTVPAYASNQNRIWSGIFDPSAGHFLRLNGNQVASNTNLTGMATANQLKIGTDSYNILPYNGYIFDVLIFYRSLNSTEIVLVENYLNAKYQLFNIADIPTISLSTVTLTGYSGFSFLSFAPMSSWSETQNLTQTLYGQASTTSTVTLLNTFNKTLAVGLNAENWSASSQYITGLSTSTITLPYSRQLAISTILAADQVKIEALDLNDGSNNIHDLSKFEEKNEVEATNYLTIGDDYIELKFSADDLNKIDIINSFIQFQNISSSPTKTAKIFFSSSINEFILNSTNTLKWKKSFFTLSGTTNWADVSIYFAISVKTTTGSQNCYYGDLKLNKNFDTSISTLVSGSPARIGQNVSSDGGTTYFRQLTDLGIVGQKYIRDDDIQFNFMGYLDYIKSLTFGQLPAFPKNFVVFNQFTNLTSYSDIVKKVLGFAFPQSFLNIQLNLNTGLDDQDINSNSVLQENLNAVPIYATDKIGDVLDTILNSIFATVFYSPIDGQIVAKNFYKLWDDTNYVGGVGILLDTPFYISDDLIENYGDETSLQQFIINDIQIDSTEYIIKHDIVYNNNDASFILPPNSITTFTLDAANIKVNGYVYAVLFNIATTPQNTTYVNTLVYISNVTYDGKSFLVTFNNQNSSVRYVRQLQLNGQFIDAFKRSVSSNGILFSPTVEYIDTASVQKYGQKLATTESTKTISGIGAAGGLSTMNYYSSVINKFKDYHELVLVTIQYTPQIAIGKVVKIKNRQNRLISGTVIKCDSYSGDDFSQTITVREI